jgi:hypothetical protein
MTRLRKAGMLGLLVSALVATGCTPVGPKASPLSRQDFLPYEKHEEPAAPAPKDFNPADHDGPQLPPKVSLGAPSPSPSLYRAQIPEAPPSHVAASAPTTLPLPSAGDLATHRVRICAWVNSKPLFEGELNYYAKYELAKLANLAEPQRTVARNEILKKYLDRLIEQEVLYQDAVRKLEKNTATLDKLKTEARKRFNKLVLRQRQEFKLDDVQFEKFLELQGTNLQDSYRQVERDFIATEYIQSRIVSRLDKIGPQDELDYWATHKEQFQVPDRVEWEDVFLQVGTKKVPTLEYARQLAKWIADRMSEGTPIDQLLKYDDGDSSTRKGRGNGERKGDIRPPELEPHLFTLMDGQVGPPVELATGIHVYRLLKREEAHQLPFNAEVQTKIRNKLKNDMFLREREQVIHELKSRTVIETDPDAAK